LSEAASVSRDDSCVRFVITWGEPEASGGGGGEDRIRAAGALDCARDEHPATAAASIAAQIIATTPMVPIVLPALG